MTRTILVKKANGTTTRMTLEEIANMKATRTSSVFAPSPSAPEETAPLVALPVPLEPPMSPAVSPHVSEHTFIVAPKMVDESLPMLSTPHEMSTTAPVSDYFVDRAMSIKDDVSHYLPKTRMDHRSLLEHAEDARTDVANATMYPSLPITHDADVDHVISLLSFPIDKTILGRVRSLIESRRKDVRTDEQVYEYSVREMDQGGLGFLPEHADTFVKAIRSTLHLRDAGVAKVMKSSPSVVSMALREPINTAPRASFPSMPPVVSRDSEKMIRKTAQKPVLHDIIAPSSHSQNMSHQQTSVQTVGPVEELGTMTVLDFHRLGRSASERQDVMKKKFRILKEESYLLYLKAIGAWYMSPVYLAYQAVLADALSRGETLSAVMPTPANESVFSLDDVLSMVAIHKELS